MPTSTPNSTWRWTKQRGHGLRTPASRYRSLGGAPGAEGPNGRIYRSGRWQQLRDKLVAAHPYCSHCGARGVRLIADHVVELKDNGPAFDPANIQIVCAKCHAKKTAEAKRERVGGQR